MHQREDAGLLQVQRGLLAVAQREQPVPPAAFLREGVFAINLALFVVITEETVLSGPVHDSDSERHADWHRELKSMGGFMPVVIGHGRSEPSEVARPNGGLTAHDTIGVVTVHDGPAIESSEIIAPEVKSGSQRAF